MPVPPGTVSVDAAGVVSGSGLARDFFDARLAGNDLFLTDNGYAVPPDDERVPFLQYLATQSQADADVIGPLLPDP